jgi:hypothetical protein
VGGRPFLSVSTHRANFWSWAAHVSRAPPRRFGPRDRHARPHAQTNNLADNRNAATGGEREFLLPMAPADSLTRVRICSAASSEISMTRMWPHAQTLSGGLSRRHRRRQVASKYRNNCHNGTPSIMRFRQRVIARWCAILAVTPKMDERKRIRRMKGVETRGAHKHKCPTTLR